MQAAGGLRVQYNPLISLLSFSPSIFLSCMLGGQRQQQGGDRKAVTAAAQPVGGAVRTASVVAL